MHLRLNGPRPRRFRGAWALLVVIALLVAGSGALAGKGGNGGKPGGGGGKYTYSLSIPDGVYGGTSVAVLRDDAGNAVGTMPGGDPIWLRAICFQDGGSVYQEWQYLDEFGEFELTLGPTPSWSGGDASCSAEAGYFQRNRQKVVAETTFHVSG